jgi:hypothetical protein
VDKITKEWKDVDQELRQHDDFGAQIRKARNVLGDTVKSLVRGKSDTLDKAKAIYDFIKKACVWNGNFGKYTELGVRKALDAGKGNAADVNLSLVGALQSAGISSFPVILSTRDNGLAVELYPVMSLTMLSLQCISVEPTISSMQRTGITLSDFCPCGVSTVRAG